MTQQSGILSYWNMSETDPDPTVKVYRNGELIEVSGDLSFCTMNIVAPDNPDANDAAITVAYIDTNLNCIKATGEVIELNGDATYRLPLYKGKQIGSYNREITVEGNASIDGEGWLIITGDFAITGW